MLKVLCFWEYHARGQNSTWAVVHQDHGGVSFAQTKTRDDYKGLDDEKQNLNSVQLELREVRAHLNAVG